MSCPVGHTLAGLSICFLHGALCSRIEGSGKLKKFCIKYSLKGLVFAAFVACLPDIDFVPGIFVGDINYFHHQGTHSLSFAIVLSFLILLISRMGKMEQSLGWGFMSLLLIISHLGIDWLTIDKSLPFGIPVLWPFSGEYFHFENAFLPYNVRSASVASVFNVHNLRVILSELAIYLPPAIISYFLYKMARKQSPKNGTDRFLFGARI